MSPSTDRAAIGPKTPEGKKLASLEALRHGLTGQMVVMPAENLEAYKRHFASFVIEYEPQGAIESSLVQALADSSWRLNRVANLESNLLTLTAAFADPITGATKMAAAIGTHVKALANLSMHTERLSRQFEKTVTQLRDLQKTRLDKQQQDLETTLDMMEEHKAKGETYSPSEDGFVFSPAQISRAIHIRQAQKFQKAAAARRVSPMR
jgi:hypothetical protein